MTLKTMMASDITDVFFNTSDFAVLVSYTDHETGTTTASIPVIPTFELDPSNTEYGDAEMSSWVVPAASVAQPKIYDVITYNGVDYRVRNRRQGDIDGTWIVTCEAERRQRPQNIRS